MSKKKIHFMGLLTNTDSSILNVKLDHGFEMRTISEREGVKLISILESSLRTEIYKKLFMEFHCLSKDKSLYYLDFVIL